MSSCQLSHFNLLLPQPICVFSLRHCLVPYITPKTPTLLCSWYHTFSSFSFQFVKQSLLVWFKWSIVILLQQQLNSAELVREPLQHFFFLHWTFFQALIWNFHLATPFVSIYLIALTLCIILSASVEFFIANLVVCFLSYPCFCKAPSHQQYCQQHVVLSLFL